jgi:hypothetical protein
LLVFSGLYTERTDGEVIAESERTSVPGAPTFSGEAGDVQEEAVPAQVGDGWRIFIQWVSGRDAREQLKFGMPEYRIYTVVDDEKSYLGSCRIIQSADDSEAIRAAKRFLDFHELQIWSRAA